MSELADHASLLHLVLNFHRLLVVHRVVFVDFVIP